MTKKEIEKSIENLQYSLDTIQALEEYWIQRYKNDNNSVSFETWWAESNRLSNTSFQILEEMEKLYDKLNEIEET